MKKRFILPVIALVLSLVAIISAITFQNIFPTTTPYVTNQSTVNLSYGIHAEDGLSSITHSWNGTNTTLYDSSLVGYCNFDNRSTLNENDTLIHCWSPNGGFNGTITAGGINTTFISGKYGNALNFSGKNSLVNITNGQIIGDGDATACFWIYPIGLPTQGWILANGKFIFTYLSTKNMWFSSDGGGTQLTTLANSVLQNDWKFVCVQRNSSGYANIYFNSILTKSGASGVPGVGSYVLKIGSRDSFDKNFNGTIDEVMIWNRSLSQTEITQLYNTQITKYNSSYWIINMTQNTSAYSQPFFQCSTNSTGTQFCSATSTVQLVNNINVNFSNSIGIVNSVFYGTQDKGFFATNNLIDVASSGGTRDTQSNYVENRNAFLNSGMNLIRIEAGTDILYSNTTDISGVNFTGDFTTLNDTIKWAYENDLTVLLLIDAMPTWLADTTYCSTTPKSCPPSNYTKWENIINDLMNKITNNKLYSNNVMVEVWNEPDTVVFFLKDMTAGYTTINETRYIEYNKVYNSTWRAVKSFDSTIEVGGPAVANYRLAGTNARRMVSSFLSNFSNQTDFISIHQYNDAGLDYGTELSNNIALLKANLTAYNSNCTKIMITEFNEHYASIKNNTFYSNQYSESVGLFYTTILNLIPSNYSGAMHQWSEEWKYENTGEYPQWPQKWSMFSESLLDNEYNPNYNVTKNFAHLCPAGATVYVSSNDDDSIKQVSCKKGNMFSLIVINIATTPKNITLNLSMTNGTVVYPRNNMTDYETGENYPISSGIMQIGVLDSYEILYLTGDSINPTWTIYPEQSYNYERPQTADYVYANPSVIFNGEYNDSAYTLTMPNGTIITNMNPGANYSIPLYLTTSGAYSLYVNGTNKQGNFNETNRSFNVIIIGGGFSAGTIVQTETDTTEEEPEEEESQLTSALKDLWNWLNNGKILEPTGKSVDNNEGGLTLRQWIVKYYWVSIPLIIIIAGFLLRRRI